MKENILDNAKVFCNFFPGYPIPGFMDIRFLPPSSLNFATHTNGFLNLQ